MQDEPRLFYRFALGEVFFWGYILAGDSCLALSRRENGHFPQNRGAASFGLGAPKHLCAEKMVLLPKIYAQNCIFRHFGEFPRRGI